MMAILASMTLALVATPAAGQDSCPEPVPYQGFGDSLDSEPVPVTALAGRIVDPHGDPIPGKAVCLGIYRDDGKTYVGSARVDEMGRFSLKKLPVGTYRLVALMAGLWSPRLRVRLVSRGTPGASREVVVTMVTAGFYD